MPTRINDRYSLPDIGDNQLDAERSMAKVIFGLANSDFSIEEVFFIREWCEKFLRYAEKRRLDDDIAVVVYPPIFCKALDQEQKTITFDTIFQAAKILEDRPPLKVELAPEAGAVGACGCGAPEPHTPGGIHCRK